MSDIVKYDDVQGYPTSSPSSLSPEDCLALSEHCINAVDNVSNLICNTALDWKRIDQQMHQMDLEFQAFSVQRQGLTILHILHRLQRRVF